MNHHHRGRFNPRHLTLAVLLALPGLAAAFDTGSESFKIDGYLRQDFSWNMKNWADTPNYNDAGRLSMARTMLRVNMDWKATNTFSVVAKLRGAREYKTDFLKHLEKMNYADGSADNAGASGANNYASGSHGNVMDLYNKGEIRELYVDWQATDRLKFRFGKQQVVWGETDFFAANDLVHGFDFTWRSFLEPNNEELRKALIILKANIDVPEADGAIEAFIRPGWDRKKDIGTELDIYGGRWSSQPYAGVDFRNVDPYDWKNKEGDYRDVTGGIRWNGTTPNFNYSLSYLKTFWASPMLNGSSSLKFFNTFGLTGMENVPSGVDTWGRKDTIDTKGQPSAGNIIYPIVDIFGATISGYAAWADAVFSAEVAYVKDAPYQINWPKGSYPPGFTLSDNIAPGFDGLTKKDLVAWMVRMDKNIAATQSLLGTEKPMFFSVQLFDKWVQNYDKKDNLINSVGWGARTKEHSFLLTGIFALSYDNGRIQPGLVIGTDLTYKGGFYVPSVVVELTKNLKWKTEYDGFWDGGRWRDNKKCTPLALGGTGATNCDNAGLFGYFHNRDQLFTSLTYQF
ncbi:MAG: LysR family transcriptional regulator [Azonexus sp.]|jgi:hypothetical protein|nr:LysR family transcriptional regulator [Azonexus sp.]